MPNCSLPCILYTNVHCSPLALLCSLNNVQLPMLIWLIKCQISLLTRYWDMIDTEIQIDIIVLTIESDEVPNTTKCLPLINCNCHQRVYPYYSVCGQRYLVAWNANAQMILVDPTDQNQIWAWWANILFLVWQRSGAQIVRMLTLKCKMKIPQFVEQLVSS